MPRIRDHTRLQLLGPTFVEPKEVRLDAILELLHLQAVAYESHELPLLHRIPFHSRGPLDPTVAVGAHAFFPNSLLGFNKSLVCARHTKSGRHPCQIRAPANVSAVRCRYSTCSVWVPSHPFTQQSSPQLPGSCVASGLAPSAVCRACLGRAPLLNLVETRTALRPLCSAPSRLTLFDRMFGAIRYRL